MRARGCLIVTAVLVVAVGVIAATIILLHRSGAPAPKSASQIKSDIRRTFREDLQSDDFMRKHAIRELLQGAGSRCDEVEQALFDGDGKWTVSCSPGYLYRLEFDATGAPLSINRIVQR